MEDKETKKSTKKSSEIKEEKKVRRKIIRKKKQEENEIVNKTVEFTLLEVVIIILITGIAVSITSGLIVYNNYDKLFVKDENKNSKEELSEFIGVYNEIIDNYVEEVDKKELIEYAISGMYSYLGDDFSVYLDKENTETLEEQLEGEYTGIGIEMYTTIDEDGNPKETIINRVFSNTPAEEAGLKSGDLLIKVDGEDVVDAGWISDTIKKGSKDSYEITYKRDGEEFTVTLTKKRVLIDSVSSSTYGSVGYIKIDTFSNVTYAQMKDNLNKFDDSIKSLVIDLRGNTGGYLQAAYNISDLFIEEGKNIYQLKDRNEKIDIYKAKEGIYKKFNKIVVLIDGQSASASEVLTLALKESAGAVVVGTKSFGKGTVQDTKILESGSMVKYTSAYWLSPNGNSINKVGIEPDILVEDYTKQLDEALSAAE